MLYLLLLIFIIFTVVSYYSLQCDFISPSVLMGLAYVLSITCSIYCAPIWHTKIGGETVLLLSLGYTIFFVVELFMKALSSGRCSEVNYDEFEYIRMQKGVYYLYLIIAVLVTYLYYKEVYRIALGHGYNGIGSMLTIYRKVASYGLLSVDEDVNILVNQSYKIVCAGAYVFLYIFINNFLITRKWTSLLWCRIPIYIYFVSSIFTAGRLQYIRFAIAAFVMFFLIWNRRCSWNFRLSGKMIRFGIIGLILLFTAFYMLRIAVGRGEGWGYGGLYYIAHYAGSPINLFDQYIKNPLPRGEYFGEETFFSIYNALRKFGLTNYHKIAHLEFRYLVPNRINSNTYTALRRYYHDFGILGIIVFQALTSLFYSYVYYFKCRTVRCKPLTIILYSFAFYPVVLHPINEIFFSALCSISYLIFVIEIIMFWKLIHNVRFVFGNNRA